MERFTILAAAKKPDQDFNPEDLELFHGECNGGRLTVHPVDHHWWILECKRCSVKALVSESENGTSALVRTVTDGESRKLESAPHFPKDILAVRK